MEMHFPKPKPCILSYQSYKNFENVIFIGDLGSAVNAQNDILNPFSTNVALLYPLKTSEYRRFSNVLRGYRSGILVENGLK